VLLTTLLPEYEKNLILEYGDQKEEKLIIANTLNDSNLQDALNRYVNAMRGNDFWVLYD